MIETNCNSCGSLLESQLEDCKYCGTSIHSQRTLSQEDEDRIYWFLKILDVRIWRDSFDYSFDRIKKHLILTFIVLISTYSINYFLSNNLLTSIILTIIIGINPFYTVFNDYRSFLNLVSERETYRLSLKDLIQEFKEGYNYSSDDIHHVIDKKSDLPHINRVLSSTKSKEKMNSQVEYVVGNMKNFFEVNCHLHSLKNCSKLFCNSGYYLSIIYFALYISLKFIITEFLDSKFLIYNEIFCLTLVAIISAFILLEQLNKIRYIFHFFGYDPDRTQFNEKWNLVLEYMQKTKQPLDLLKETINSKSDYIRLKIYLEDNQIFDLT
ncbi:MAG: hypothetical protein SFU98_19005 [Leptospiraceae bacterium]|nr:hypothetical protein [Leptospiraceae bacterium]